MVQCLRYKRTTIFNKLMYKQINKGYGFQTAVKVSNWSYSTNHKDLSFKSFSTNKNNYNKGNLLDYNARTPFTIGNLKLLNLQPINLNITGIYNSKSLVQFMVPLFIQMHECLGLDVRKDNLPLTYILFYSSLCCSFDVRFYQYLRASIVEVRLPSFVLSLIYMFSRAVRSENRYLGEFNGSLSPNFTMAELLRQIIDYLLDPENQTYLSSSIMFSRYRDFPSQVVKLCDILKKVVLDLENHSNDQSYVFGVYYTYLANIIPFFGMPKQHTSILDLARVESFSKHVNLFHFRNYDYTYVVNQENIQHIHVYPLNLMGAFLKVFNPIFYNGSSLFAPHESISDSRLNLSDVTFDMCARQFVLYKLTILKSGQPDDSTTSSLETTSGTTEQLLDPTSGSLGTKLKTSGSIVNTFGNTRRTYSTQRRNYFIQPVRLSELYININESIPPDYYPEKAIFSYF